VAPNRFDPNAQVTRAEFAAFLDRLAHAPANTPGPAFTDVPASAWFAPYVSAAVAAGIVDGTSPTTFSPDATLSRQELAVLLARALQLSGSTTLRFTDAGQIASWARTGVEEAVAAGYMSGFPGGTFQPLGNTTRAQASKVLATVLRQRL
jgi:hypothetical protein